MSSSADSAARPLPRLARVWDGQVEPLNTERLKRPGGPRVSGRAGAGGRGAGAAARGRRRARDRSVGRVPHPRRGGALAVVSGHQGAAGRRRLRSDRALQGRRARTRGSSPTRAAIRRPRCWRCCRSRRPVCSTRRPGVIIDAKSGISGAGRAPSDRTHFSENHGSVSAYGVFGHRHVAEMEQELGASVTFVPHLVPLDRGILETIYVRVRAGHDRRADRGRLRRRVSRRAVRAADRRGAAGDQARRVDELLRHRLAARRAVAGGS